LSGQQHGAHESTRRLEVRSLRVRSMRHLAALAAQIRGLLEQAALRGSVRRDEPLQVGIVDLLLDILEDPDRLHSLAMQVVESGGRFILYERHGAYTSSAPGSTANVAGVCVLR